jgi:integrase
MLGFLNFKGVCPPGLADALPRIRRWRHATLPEILSGDQIEKMISATALSESGHRLRDRAIVVLLAKTGMRALGDKAYTRRSRLAQRHRTYS